MFKGSKRHSLVPLEYLMMAENAKDGKWARFNFIVKLCSEMTAQGCGELLILLQQADEASLGEEKKKFLENSPKSLQCIYLGLKFGF